MRSSLVAVVLFSLLIPFSSALENCADAFYVSYASSALITIFHEDISPGVPVVIVRAQKENPFWFPSNVTKSFYVAAADQVSRDGVKIASAGEVFWKSYYEPVYFNRAWEAKPLYSANNDSLFVSFDRNAQFSYAAQTFTTDLLRVSSSKTPAAFGVENSVGGEIVVLTKTLSALNKELERGSVFLKTDEGKFVYAKGGLVYYIGTCAASCSDPDFADYYAASSCTSVLTRGDDYCIGSATLAEFTCSPKTVSCGVEQFSCPFGCEDGKCKTGVKPLCSESTGSVSGTYANATKFYFQNSCEGGKLVNYYCNRDGTPAKNAVSCPSGQSCPSGGNTCVPSQATAVSCSDTDGGKNYEVAGTCADAGGSYKDSCSQSGVVEYYCENNACSFAETTCPSCSQGACSKESLIPTSNLGIFIGLIVVIGVLAYVFSMRKGRDFGKRETVEEALKGLPSFSKPKPERKKPAHQKKKR